MAGFGSLISKLVDFQGLFKGLVGSLYRSFFATEIAAEADKLKALEARYASLHASSEATDKANADLRAKNATLQADVDARQKAIEGLNAQIDALDAQLKGVQDEMDRKKADIDRLSDSDAFDRLQGSKR